MNWYCVKDKLPNIKDVVLTYWNGGKYCVMLYCGNNGKSWFSEKGEYKNVYQEFGIDLFECITHWQYLPKPPTSYNNDCTTFQKKEYFMIGSMLSPFCFHRCSKRHWWIMIIGFQFIYRDGWFKFNIIKWKQWSIKLKWIFLKRSYNSDYKKFLRNLS
jgi:hypothetical protein